MSTIKLYGEIKRKLKLGKIREVSRSISDCGLSACVGMDFSTCTRRVKAILEELQARNLPIATRSSH